MYSNIYLQLCSVTCTDYIQDIGVFVRVHARAYYQEAWVWLVLTVVASQ
jgi:hypothetical protein